MLDPIDAEPSPDDAGTDLPRRITRGDGTDVLLQQAFETARSSKRQVDRDRCLRAFYLDSRVRRTLLRLASDHRLYDHVDEARQRVAILLDESWLGIALASTDPPDHIYRLVYTLSANAFRSIFKETLASNSRSVSIDQEADEDPDGSRLAQLGLPASGSSIEETEERIDMENAQQELDRRLRMLSAIPSSDRAATETLAPLVEVPEALTVTLTPPRRRRTARSDSDGGTTLRTIQQQLGLTNAEYAVKLGIGLPTLSSYVYNRVHTVPAAIIDRAQELLKDTPPEKLKLISWFNGLTMPQICDHWAKLLKLSPTDANAQDAAIAAVLSCNPITVWRWRKSDTKPPVQKLLEYHSSITASSRSPLRTA